MENLVLYITNKCNLNCSYCYVHKNNEVMSLQTYIKVFNEYKNKIKNIIFYGGEPLLEFDLICQIIEYNKLNGYIYNYIVNTNGINIDNNVLEVCKRENILVNVSLDGNYKSNNKNRFDKEIFKVVEKNIKLLKSNNIKVIINYVITPNNIEFINDSLNYFIDNSFNNVCLMVNYDALWTKNDIKILRNQLEKSLLSMLKIVDNDFVKIYPIYNKINCIFENKKEEKCIFGKDSIVISSDGKKYPCISFIYDKNYEIINDNEKFTNICEVEKCKNCEYNNLCVNNCMCRFCFCNKNVEFDINCECEKIFIDIAKKIVEKMLNHELNI